MKVFFLLWIIVFSSISLHAGQDAFLKSSFKSGAYIGPAVKFSDIESFPGTFIGVRGGWVIGSSFVIGGGIYELINNVDLRRIETASPTGDNAFLGMRYGGLELEYIHRSYSRIHIVGSLLIGSGIIGTRDRGTLVISVADRSFNVIEPGLMLEFNIFSFLRIAPGFSWRFVERFSSPLLDSNQIDGFNGILVIKLGSF